MCLELLGESLESDLHFWIDDWQLGLGGCYGYT